LHENIPSLPRRHLLAGSAATLAALGLASWTRGAQAQTAAARPLPAYAAWKDASSVIVHSATTIETKRSAFGTSVITPGEQLYIRNNLPAPDASILADRDGWQIAIEGVRYPGKLAVGQLKAMGVETWPPCCSARAMAVASSRTSPVARPGRWALPAAWCGAVCRCAPWSRRWAA